MKAAIPLLSLLPLLPAVVAVLAGCPPAPERPTREPTSGSINVVAAPSPERIQAGEARRGIGWYPDVEVDDHDRVHIAWTDADLGDVMYAVSATGGTLPQDAEAVETHGAAGGFVHLALVAGGEPVISYYHQGEHTLRVAHREKDLAAMKKSGADVDTNPAPKEAVKALAPGWVGEDIAFGDDAGAGSALAVDKHGRPHLLYAVKGNRMRYARRPDGVPAFGAGGAGHWEKVDVDPQNGQSPAVIDSLVVLDDGTTVASFCDWQVVMAHLKLAVRPASSSLFTVTPARAEPKPGIDGSSSSLLPRPDGKLDVAAVRRDDGALLLGTFDPRAPAPLVDRHRVAAARGPSVVRRAKDGTLFVLMRDPDERKGRTPGLYLVDIPPNGDDPKKPAGHRTLLEKGTQDDIWLDLALLSDGRPVAVWFSEDAKGLKLYTP